MKLITGILGLVFVAITALDLGEVVVNYSARNTSDFAIGIIFEAVVALLLLVFTFQKHPSGV